MVPGKLVFNLQTTSQAGTHTETFNYDSFDSLCVAAEKGEPASQYILGNCLNNGSYTSKDEKRGMEYLVRSANQGFKYAQLQLHNCFLYKKGAALWNMPSLPSSNIRRAKDLKAIQQHFEDTTPPPPRRIPENQWPLALIGFPGVGKTHLALQYVYSVLTDESRVVFFSRDKLQEQFINFAITINNSQYSVTCIEDARRIINTQIQTFKQYQWIFVFDDPESYDEVSKILLTWSPNLKTIITTSQTDFSSAFKGVYVKEMLPADSITIINNKNIEGGSQSMLSQLAETMGFLPPAIEQAIFIIKENKLSIKDFLENFKKNPSILFRDKSFSQSTKEVSISDRWSKVIHEIRQDHPSAYDMLVVCAYFSPKKILRKFLESWFEKKYFSRGMSELECDDAFGEIFSHSLLTSDGYGSESYLIINPLFCKFLRYDHANFSHNFSDVDPVPTKAQMEASILYQFSYEWFLPLFSLLENEIKMSIEKEMPLDKKSSQEVEAKVNLEILLRNIKETLEIKETIFKDSIGPYIHNPNLLRIIMDYDPFMFMKEPLKHMEKTFLIQLGLHQQLSIFANADESTSAKSAKQAKLS